MAVGSESDRPYHSANVIRELVGKDVVSFGQAAAGSAEALVLAVTQILRDPYCYLFPRLERPKRLFIYFYEGNDIYDNHRVMQRAVREGGPDRYVSVDRLLDEKYGSLSRLRCHTQFGSTMWRAARSFIGNLFGTEGALDKPPTGNTVLIGDVDSDAPTSGSAGQFDGESDR